jgi:transcriptional regulator with XRE-family HTH domain
MYDSLMKTSARTQVSEWLKQNRYTQREFASIIGVNETHMSRILSDATKAKPGRVLRKMVAATTGLDVASEEAWK